MALTKSQRLAAASRNVEASVGGASKKGRGAPAPPPRAPFGGDQAALVGTRLTPQGWRVPIDRIEPDPDQPRKEFDPIALDRLADSLRERGQLQPIRVRWAADRRVYVIVAGERRYRAAQLAGLEELLCVAAEGEGFGLDREREVFVDQLVENCCREDLGPIEEAKAFKALADRTAWSAREMAKQLGVTHDRVTRSLALLRLPDEVLDLVEDGHLAPSVALECGKAEGARACELAEAAVQHGLSRDDVAKLRSHTALVIDPYSLFDEEGEPTAPVMPTATRDPLPPPVTHGASSAPPPVAPVVPTATVDPARDLKAEIRRFDRELTHGASHPAPKEAVATVNGVKAPADPPIAPTPTIVEATPPAVTHGASTRPRYHDVPEAEHPAWETAVYLDGVEHRVILRGPSAVPGPMLVHLARLGLDAAVRAQVGAHRSEGGKG